MKRMIIVIILLLAGHQGFNQRAIVRVMSFNILHGATTLGNFDLDAIAKVINDVSPDFVALQEVDFKTQRAKNYDLATELGFRTKMAPLFGKAMDYDGGGYGEGVLSKYSFVNTRNVALPYSPGNEPRAALEVVTVLPSGDTVAFIGTHLDHLHNDSDRKLQAEKINQVFSSNKFPTILAGDLNDTIDSPAIRILEKIWTSTCYKTDCKPTFPSTLPAKKIDHVMVLPKDRWKVIETKVIQDTVASDHCALLVTLELITK